MNKTFLGYKIFDSLQDFYDWQGYNGDPAIGTVNQMMGFSTSNPIRSVRFTYPIPHPTATSVEYDNYNMPTSIIGNDQRVLAQITNNCPPQCLPSGLINRDQAILEGWHLGSEEEI